MNVLFISRSTLFSQPGGDTLQVKHTAKSLSEIGVNVDIKLSGEPINPRGYDIIHFFNLIRPADLQLNIPAYIPLVVSTIYHDYSEYDSRYRSKFSGLLFRLTGKNGLEYLKVILRWLNGSDKFPGLKYLLIGHKRSMRYLLKRANFALTTSHQEADLIRKDLGYLPEYKKINLGSEHIKHKDGELHREGVLCAARIEGFKNQLNLIRAVKGTGQKLTLTGNIATNQQAYYNQCRAEADGSVTFLGRVSNEKLESQFRQAHTHALISYYETTGLSTLEALKAGCQAVITDRGAQREIFEGHGFFCQPDDVDSIKEALQQAEVSTEDHSAWVTENFSWKKAAHEISDIYQKLLHPQHS